MSKIYRFLSPLRDTKDELAPDSEKAGLYLSCYVPGYRVMGDLVFLRGVSNAVARSVEQGIYNKEGGELCLSIFHKEIHRSAREDGDSLSEEAVRRYLDVAKEYMEYLGGISLEDAHLAEI